MGYPEQIVELKKQIVELKKLVLDLTDGDFLHPAEIQRQTGHSLSKCGELLNQIDEIRTQAIRGQL